VRRTSLRDWLARARSRVTERIRSSISKWRVLNLRMVSVTPERITAGSPRRHGRCQSGSRESRMGLDRNIVTIPQIQHPPLQMERSDSRWHSGSAPSPTISKTTSSHARTSSLVVVPATGKNAALIDRGQSQQAERVLVIEDTAEIRLPAGNGKGKPSYGLKPAAKPERN